MRIYSSEIGTHALEQDHVSGGVLFQSVLHLPPFGPVDTYDPIPEQPHQQCGLHYMSDFNRATVSGRVVHRSLKRRTRSHRTTSCRWCRSQDSSTDGKLPHHRSISIRRFIHVLELHIDCELRALPPSPQDRRTCDWSSMSTSTYCNPHVSRATAQCG
jgi:hypothetical protein